MSTRIEGGGAGVHGARGFLGALALLLLSPVFFGVGAAPGVSEQDRTGGLFHPFSRWATLAAQDIRYSGSLSYSGGQYFFEETTHSFYFGNTLALRFGSLEMSLNLPVVVQNGGLVSFVGGTPVPTGGEQNDVVGRKGSGGNLGTQGGGHGGASQSVIPPSLFSSVVLSQDVGDSLDVAFSDSYSAKVADPFFQGSLNLFEGFGVVRSLGVRLGIKPPIVGLDSGVGTGEWDMGAGGTMVLGKGSTLLFGDLGYWRYGDLPGLELEDGFSYAGGVSRSLIGSRASVMISLAGAQALIASAESPLSVSLGLGYLLGSGRMINVSAAAGLSETSPDWSLTLGWSVGGA